jgi:hypothetical protein
MRLLHHPAAALAWLGRHGTSAVAVSIFLGLAVPPLAALFKPLVPETIFLLLMLAFLRVDAWELRARFAAPGLVVLATAWIMLAVPAALGLVFLAFGLPELAPLRARARLRPSQLGPDAGRDRRRGPRPHLALFRHCPVPDLSAAAIA